MIVHLVLSSIAAIVEGSEFDISSCYANRTPRGERNIQIGKIKLIPPTSTYVVIAFLVVSVITVIITVIVDAISFVQRYPALTCSADMLRRADCSAALTWHAQH